MSQPQQYRTASNGPIALVCPVCGCAVHDATVHTEWHQKLADLVNALNAVRVRK